MYAGMYVCMNVHMCVVSARARVWCLLEDVHTIWTPKPLRPTFFGLSIACCCHDVEHLFACAHAFCVKRNTGKWKEGKSKRWLISGFGIDENERRMFFWR